MPETTTQPAVSHESPRAPEVDLLAALSLQGLLRVLVGCALGALLGYGVGRAFLRTYEARAVFRVANVGQAGPVIPASEIKARCESRSQAIKHLEGLGVSDATRVADSVRILAETGGAEGSVVVLTVTGPQADHALALCKAITSAMVDQSHQAFSTALAEKAQRLAHANQVSESFQKVAQRDPGAANTAEQTLVALEFQRWAGEVLSTRRTVEERLAESRDAEVIDAPFERESPARVLLLTALGAFAGLLVGLGGAARPQGR